MSSAPSPTEAPRVDGPVGLGGWLILVGLGLVVSPIIVLNTIATDLLPLFQPDFWPVLTDPASEAYHPLWAPLLIFELAGNLLQVLVLLAALILFFQKSPHFRRWRSPCTSGSSSSWSWTTRRPD